MVVSGDSNYNTVRKRLFPLCAARTGVNARPDRVLRGEKLSNVVDRAGAKVTRRSAGLRAR
jgi:hypothetical protein